MSMCCRLSDALKAAVRSARLTGAKLAELTGGAVSPSELSKWLSGKSRLGQRKADAIAAALGAELVYGPPSDRERILFERLRTAADRVSADRNAELVEELAEG